MQVRRVKDIVIEIVNYDMKDYDLQRDETALAHSQYLLDEKNIGRGDFSKDGTRVDRLALASNVVEGHSINGTTVKKADEQIKKDSSSYETVDGLADSKRIRGQEALADILHE